MRWQPMTWRAVCVRPYRHLLHHLALRRADHQVVGGQRVGRRRAGPHAASPHCLLRVYRYTRTHAPHPPPWPFMASHDCLPVLQSTRTHSPHPPPWLLAASPLQLNLKAVAVTPAGCPLNPLSSYQLYLAGLGIRKFGRFGDGEGGSDSAGFGQRQSG